MKPEIIVRIPFRPEAIELFRRDFTVHYAPTLDEFEKTIDAHPDALALVTNGSIGVTADQLGRLKKVGFIQTQGVGFENVDMPTVNARGIKVATGKGTNANSVADHGMALLLAIARNIVWADKRVREGLWLKSRDNAQAEAANKRLGIMGLGEIGLLIAKRAEGFGMDISYHNRNKRSDVDYTYVADPMELARSSDFVLIVMPGGPASRGLVNRDFLDALGPNGYLINIGRGTIVDTAELISALHDKRIAGAAIDVVAGEPTVTPELLAAPNLVITPHIAGRSEESVVEAMNRVSHNLNAYFAGKPLISQIV